MKVTVAPGSSVISKTSASRSVRRTGRMPALGVSAVMRSAPRSGRKMPEPGQAEERRDQQALDLRVAVVAQREQRPVGIGAAARAASTSMRRMMPSSPGAVESCDLAVLARDDVDAAGEVDRVDVLGDRDDLEAERRPEADERKAEAHRKDGQMTH